MVTNLHPVAVVCFIITLLMQVFDSVEVEEDKL